MWLRLTAEDHEVYQLAQFLHPVPGVQGRDIVLADEVEQFGVRRQLDAQFQDGVDGEGRAGAVQFAVVERETFFARERRGEHGQTLGAGRARRAAQLVRRHGGRDENQMVQGKGLDRVAPEDQVSVVDRVEGAAVEADSLWLGRCHGCSPPDAGSAGLRGERPQHSGNSGVFHRQEEGPTGMELAFLMGVKPALSPFATAVLPAVSRRLRLAAALAAGLLTVGTLTGQTADKPLRTSQPLSVEKALPIKEVCLLLRSGYTGDEVLREVATRRLLEPVDPAAEAQLKTAGATSAFLNTLKAGNYNLSETDAATARARQADIEQREQVTRSLALNQQAPSSAAAGSSRGVAGQPRSLLMEGLLHNRLVTMRDARFYRYDENKFAEKRLFAVYFSASWCGPCKKFTPLLVKFYNDFVKLHPEFELIFVSKDRSALAMQQYMQTDQMPWPAVPYEQLDQISQLNKLCGEGIPDLVLLDDSGRVLSDSYREGKYVGPGEVIKDLLARVGTPVR